MKNIEQNVTVWHYDNGSESLPQLCVGLIQAGFVIDECLVIATEEYQGRVTAASVIVISHKQ